MLTFNLGNKFGWELSEMFIYAKKPITHYWWYRKQLANMEDSHVVNHAESWTQQSPKTQTGSINASIDHDNFLTSPPRPIKEALQDTNNQINDLRNIIGNQG